MYSDIERALQPHGLICRGGFSLAEMDELGGTGSLVLIGNAGPALWQSFQADNKTSLNGDKSNPLDGWTRSCIDDIAQKFRSRAVYPFDGPPYHPFQQWAMRAEPVYPSPIGPLVHPVYGLWHAYRGALIVDGKIDFPTAEKTASPCETCVLKPCLTRCPVNAFQPETYDVQACVGHLTVAPKDPCRTSGCLARHACPIGQSYAYLPEQAQFHMDKFVESQSPRSV